MSAQEPVTPCPTCVTQGLIEPADGLFVDAMAARLAARCPTCRGSGSTQEPVTEDAKKIPRELELIRSALAVDPRLSMREIVLIDQWVSAILVAHERLTAELNAERLEVISAIARKEAAMREAHEQRERAEHAETEVERLTAEIDSAWEFIEHGYDIEPRAEVEASDMVGTIFKSPLAMAMHLIWKRDPIVADLLAEVERLTAALAQAQARIAQITAVLPIGED